MKTFKVFGIIILVIIAGLGVILFILYATIKTKSTSLNNYAPYKDYIGKTVILNKETILYKVDSRTFENDDYPYNLIDSLNPMWEDIKLTMKTPNPYTQEISRFPAGTNLTIDKSVQYTNGVSGSSYPTVFGTIKYQNKTYKIGYSWGEKSASKDYSGIKECWYFHQAPWQDKHDSTFYALPTAKIW